MVGDYSRLCLEKCNSEVRLNEIRRCKLTHIVDAIEYWNCELFRRKILHYEHFNEIFGPLVADTQLQFRDFLRMDQESQQEDRITKDAWRIDAMETFATFILLSHESLQPRLKFLFDLFGKQHDKFNKNSLKHMLLASTRGISRLFKGITDRKLDQHILSYCYNYYCRNSMVTRSRFAWWHFRFTNDVGHYVYESNIFSCVLGVVPGQQGRLRLS